MAINLIVYNIFRYSKFPLSVAANAAPTLPEGEARACGQLGSPLWGSCRRSRLRGHLALPLGELSAKLTERAERAEKAKVTSMKPPKNNNLLPRARALRRDMTPQERKLW